MCGNARFGFVSKGQQVSCPCLKSGTLLWQIFVSIVNRGYGGTVVSCVSQHLRDGEPGEPLADFFIHILGR